MNLFKNKDTKTDGKDSPKYFETWGEIVAFARFSKIVALIALFLAFIVLFWALRVLNRPAMVIRIDSLGNPSITDFKHNQNITREEIQNFVAYFVEYYTAWDVHTYEEYSSRAVRMMTPNMLQAAKSYHDNNSISELVVSKKVKRKVKVTEANIKSIDKCFISVEVRGNRAEGSYDNLEKKDVVFSIDMNIAIVPRTESLWGMLVDTFEEHIYSE
ncbi:MAG: VirB8/TrbF family protein [Elusimicrobiota bacterium]